MCVLNAEHPWRRLPWQRGARGGAQEMPAPHSCIVEPTRVRRCQLLTRARGQHERAAADLQSRAWRDGDAGARVCAGSDGGCCARQQIVRTKAESQRIVATRPLCRVQYPVPYSSRLQVIHRAGSGNCDRSRLMQYVRAWLPRRGRPQSFRHGFHLQRRSDVIRRMAASPHRRFQRRLYR